MIKIILVVSMLFFAGCAGTSVCGTYSQEIGNGGNGSVTVCRDLN